MGIVCCHPSKAFNPDSRKLLQLKNPEKNPNELIQDPQSTTDIPLLILDVEEEKIFTSRVSLRIITSLEGISQLNVNNVLYLCGSESDSNIGSFLFKIDNTKSINSVVSILVNAQYSHKYPSMIYLPDNSLLIVGGEKQIKCEQFEIASSKWRYLPDLPEERYKASLVLVEERNFVYLFGGFCSETGTNCTDILRIDTNSLMIWEKLLVKEGKDFLSKTSCGMLSKYNKEKGINRVYILGGENNEKELCDSVIEYDIKKRVAKKIKGKLKYKAAFLNQNGVNVGLNTYILFDKKGNIHRVNFQDFKIYSNINDEDEEMFK